MGEVDHPEGRGEAQHRQIAELHRPLHQQRVLVAGEGQVLPRQQLVVQRPRVLRVRLAGLAHLVQLAHGLLEIADVHHARQGPGPGLRRLGEHRPHVFVPAVDALAVQGALEAVVLRQGADQQLLVHLHQGVVGLGVQRHALQGLLELTHVLPDMGAGVGQLVAFGVVLGEAHLLAQLLRQALGRGQP